MLVAFRTAGILGWLGYRPQVPSRVRVFQLGCEGPSLSGRALPHDSQPLLLSQASFTPEDWFGSAWRKRNGTPDPSCLLVRKVSIFQEEKF